MAFNMRDVETYRRDAKMGGKLLTPEERMRIAKVQELQKRAPIPVTNISCFAIAVPAAPENFDSSRV